ncbi:MAG: hypothetical protein ACM3Q4_12620 [Acidobacteriota bacterium]
MRMAGIVILIIGLIMTIYTGFTFVTKDKVADVGPIEITKEKEHSADWSPYVGVGLIVIGGALVVLGKKK